MATHTKYYVDEPCILCGKIRPVRKDLLNNPKYIGFCRSCAGKYSMALILGKRIQSNEHHPTWKGGRHVNNFGYMTTRIKGKRYLEHRLIMEKVLGRPLKVNEIVHHINGDKLDNRPENLRVIERKKHSPSYTLGYSEGLQAGYNKAMEELNAKVS